MGSSTYQWVQEYTFKYLHSQEQVSQLSIITVLLFMILMICDVFWVSLRKQLGVCGSIWLQFIESRFQVKSRIAVLVKFRMSYTYSA